MPIHVSDWGHAFDRPVHRFKIANARGASLDVSDYGATAVEMHMPAPGGAIADIILGYGTVAEYMRAPTYFGATAGRFANRLRHGRFSLDGESFQVPPNEGANALHGGPRGFDKHVWNASHDPDGDTVMFRMNSPDGDQGFPGNLEVTTSYMLTSDNIVRIEIGASTDRPTLCNIVHHSYFNLAGHDSGSALDQELMIASDFYTPVDEELIITGEVLKVDGTPFDFRTPRPIGARLDELPRNAGAGRLADGASGGYDHNWCLRGEPGVLRHAATARDPVSGRGFDLWTNQPGVHFYTGGYLAPSMTGKGGKPLARFGGYTFETQKFPDGPNLSHVPQSRLDPGGEYRHIMELRFHE